MYKDVKWMIWLCLLGEIGVVRQGGNKKGIVNLKGKLH